MLDKVLLDSFVIGFQSMWITNNRSFTLPKNNESIHQDRELILPLRYS
jgi:hypothetical protein